MRWRNIVFVTSVLVFVLSSPVASQDWVDIKDPNELRALHSDKTFIAPSGAFLSPNITVPTARGFWISAELRMPCTWEVKGNDQVCISYPRRAHGVGSSNAARRTQTSMLEGSQVVNGVSMWSR